MLDHDGVEPVKVQLHYLKPIPYEEYKDMNTNEIATMVHDRIEKKLVEVGAIYNGRFCDLYRFVL